MCLSNTSSHATCNEGLNSAMRDETGIRGGAATDGRENDCNVDKMAIRAWWIAKRDAFPF